MRTVSDDRALHIQGRLRLRRTAWLGCVACGAWRRRGQGVVDWPPRSTHGQEAVADKGVQTRLRLADKAATDRLTEEEGEGDADRGSWTAVSSMDNRPRRGSAAQRIGRAEDRKTGRAEDRAEKGEGGAGKDSLPASPSLSITEKRVSVREQPVPAGEPGTACSRFASGG